MPSNNGELGSDRSETRDLRPGAPDFIAEVKQDEIKAQEEFNATNRKQQEENEKSGENSEKSVDLANELCAKDHLYGEAKSVVENFAELYDI